VFHVSERRVCRAMEQPRSTQRYQGKEANDEELLTERIVTLASQYGRYGYRRITAMLQMEGWQVNHKRVERIWRQEGLKVPKKQPKRGRLWLNDGSCLRLRPEYPDHVWSYDFVSERTHDGRAFRILNVIDEYSRECLPIGHGTVWQSRWNKTLTMKMFRNAWRSYSVPAEFPPICVLITVPNSSPTNCASGSTDWA
jgi:putative transposase